MIIKRKQTICHFVNSRFLELATGKETFNIAPK